MTLWILPLEMKAGQRQGATSAISKSWFGTKVFRSVHFLYSIKGQGLPGLVSLVWSFAFLAVLEGSVPFILPYSMAPLTCWSWSSRCSTFKSSQVTGHHWSSLVIPKLWEAQADVGQKDACWPWGLGALGPQGALGPGIIWDLGFSSSCKPGSQKNASCSHCPFDLVLILILSYIIHRRLGNILA